MGEQTAFALFNRQKWGLKWDYKQQGAVALWQKLVSLLEKLFANEIRRKCDVSLYVSQLKTAIEL